jgi:hypothetical protein
MKKLIFKLATVLIIAFAIGAVIGSALPSDANASGCNCIGLETCYWHGDPGTGGCAPNEVPWKLYSMSNDCGNCCGSVLSSGCEHL